MAPLTEVEAVMSDEVAGYDLLRLEIALPWHVERSRERLDDYSEVGFPVVTPASDLQVPTILTSNGSLGNNHQGHTIRTEGGGDFEGLLRECDRATVVASEDRRAMYWQDG